MTLGPKVRLTYMDKYITSPPIRHALLVGVVNDDECNLLESKGYQVTKADLYPRNESIVQLDLTHPPEEMKGKFYLVVASDVLEHIEDDRAAVKGIYELLLTGGMAYVHVPGGDINAPLDDTDREHGHVRHGYAEEQINQVIKSQPFSNIEYKKTFNDIETQACLLFRDGNKEAALKKLNTSPFDGKEGRSHLFLLTK